MQVVIKGQCFPHDCYFESFKHRKRLFLCCVLICVPKHIERPYMNTKLHWSYYPYSCYWIFQHTKTYDTNHDFSNYSRCSFYGCYWMFQQTTNVWHTSRIFKLFKVSILWLLLNASTYQNVWHKSRFFKLFKVSILWLLLNVSTNNKCMTHIKNFQTIQGVHMVTIECFNIPKCMTQIMIFQTIQGVHIMVAIECFNTKIVWHTS